MPWDRDNLTLSQVKRDMSRLLNIKKDLSSFTFDYDSVQHFKKSLLYMIDQRAPIEIIALYQKLIDRPFLIEEACVEKIKLMMCREDAEVPKLSNQQADIQKTEMQKMEEKEKRNFCLNYFGEWIAFSEQLFALIVGKMHENQKFIDFKKFISIFGKEGKVRDNNLNWLLLQYLCNTKYFFLHFFISQIL